MPAPGGEDGGAGLVLEHPAGEVASGPRRERRGPDRRARPERDPQDVLQERGEAEIGAEHAVDVGAVGRSHVTAACDGELNITSARGRGTTVTLTVPVLAAA